MSWRDRATPVETPPPKGNWRDRAKRIEPAAEAAPPAEPSLWDKAGSALQGAGEGAAEFGGQALNYLGDLGGKAIKLAPKALAYHQDPIGTVKKLADFSPQGLGGAVLHAGGAGISGGLTQTLEGLRGAYQEARRPLAKLTGTEELEEKVGLSPQPQSVWDAFRRARDQRRHDDEVSAAAHPDESAALELGGALAMPIPAIKGAGLAGKMASGALIGGGVGGVYGVGGSEAKTLGGVAKDALKSGLVGVGGGGFGGGLTRGAERLATRWGGKAAKMKANVAAKDLEKGVNSARGSYGSKTQNSNRALENIHAAAANPRLSQEVRDAANAFLDSPEGVALAEQVAKNTLEQAPTKMGEMAAARAALTEAPEAAAKKTADYFEKSTVRNDVLPRVSRYGGRFVPGAVGAWIGGLEGAAIGTALGYLTGHAGTSIANLVQKNPRFVSRLNEKLERGASAFGGALGKYTPLMAGASLEMRANILEKAMQEDPDVVKKVEDLLIADQAKEPSKLEQHFNQ